MNSYDEITPGLWYLTTSFGVGYTVVDVMISMYGEDEDEKIVFVIGEDDSHEIEAYAPEQFIEPVPAPVSRTLYISRQPERP